MLLQRHPWRGRFVEGVRVVARAGPRLVSAETERPAGRPPVVIKMPLPRGGGRQTGDRPRMPRDPQSPSHRVGGWRTVARLVVRHLNSGRCPFGFGERRTADPAGALATIPVTPLLWPFY
jgi:hypothetical protein